MQGANSTCRDPLCLEVGCLSCRCPVYRKLDQGSHRSFQQTPPSFNSPSSLPLTYLIQFSNKYLLLTTLFNVFIIVLGSFILVISTFPVQILNWSIDNVLSTESCRSPTSSIYGMILYRPRFSRSWVSFPDHPSFHSHLLVLSQTDTHDLFPFAEGQSTPGGKRNRQRGRLILPLHLLPLSRPEGILSILNLSIHPNANNIRLITRKELAISARLARTVEMAHLLYHAKFKMKIDTI